MRYPVTLTRDDNDTILVTFPDLPEAITYGETEDEALGRAHDAFATAVDALIRDRRDIPAPSDRGTHVIDVPALLTAKIELYRTMRAQDVNKAELGRRLRWHLPQVDRLLNVRHASRLDQLEAAFEVLGKRLECNVTAVANHPARVASVYRRSRTNHRVALGPVFAARGSRGHVVRRRQR